jgi:hypothetical protein
MATDQSIEGVIVELEARYMLLDSSLIRAIASDYDIHTQYAEIIEQLELLTAEVAADDDLDFDPSGSGGHKLPSTKDSQETAQYQSSSSVEGSGIETTPHSELVTLANALSSVGTDSRDNSSTDLSSLRYFVTLDDNDKLTRLADMFPDMKTFDHIHALKKANGNFVRAVESLLTQAFLQEESTIIGEDTIPLKGIDGFAEQYIVPARRKRRNRKDKSKSSSSELSEEILPKYAPLKLNLTETSDSFSALTPKSQSTLNPVGGSYAESAQREFTKASEYYRRSKSNHLMGGAAAYYSSVGREHLANAKHTVSAHADQLAVKQSSATHVDLHGMTLDDSRRVALEYVSKWWDDLGEGRVNQGGKSTIGQGYQVIVGKGNHSAGKISVLGPAVFKALEAAGWKVQIGNGVLIVKGRKTR